MSVAPLQGQKTYAEALLEQLVASGISATIVASASSPVFTTLLQQVVNSEVTFVMGAWVGDPTKTLDKDATTGSISGTGPFITNFKYPILINHIGSICSIPTLTVTVTGVDGTVTTIDTAKVATTGYDSGLFAAPILAKSVTLNNTGLAGTITETAILRAIDVEEQDIPVTNDPDYPLFVQDKSIVVVDEVDLTSGSGIFTPANIPRLFDFDDTVGVTITGPGALTLKTPIKCSELLVVWAPGVALNPITVILFDQMGNVLETITDIGLVTGDRQEAHMEFTLAAVKSIEVTCPDADAVIYGVQLTKVKETKAMTYSGDGKPISSTALPTSPVGAEALDVNSMANRIQATTKQVFMLRPVVQGTPEVGNPAAPGPASVPFTGDPSADLNSMGFDVEAFWNLGLNLEMSIQPDVGVTSINASVDWYYSYDDVIYYYGGTTVFTDTAGAITGNPNPTGFQAAPPSAGLDTSLRNLAHPLTMFAKYIAIVVRNNVATPITVVEGRFVPQR